MIVVLLIAVVAILLFGAATFRRWLSGAFQLSIAMLAVLLVIGWAAARYRSWDQSHQHAAQLIQAKAMTLEQVAFLSKKPLSQLLDVATYDAGEFIVCGTLANTSGYGGTGERQRWLSNGGGRTEFERRNGKEQFDSRERLLCTSDESAALRM